jgi:hypothetical protein
MNLVEFERDIQRVSPAQGHWQTPPVGYACASRARTDQ